MRGAAPLARLPRLVDACIDLHHLDLHGLTVLTEGATGAYAWTAALAARAGAEVYAMVADNRFATADEAARQTRAAASALGVDLEVLRDREHPSLATIDIVTNTGAVRPVDVDLLDRLQPTAVVPLMWETWEWRPGEVDLAAARERSILVLGTDEARGPAPFHPYLGALALRLLFDAGLEVYRTRVLLLGGGLAAPMAKTLAAAGAEVAWFADGESEARPFAECATWLAATHPQVDAIIVAEHRDPRPVIGPSGHLSWWALDEHCADAPLLHVAGALDKEGLRGRPHLPEHLQPFGYMSAQPYQLGPRPVLELFAAGLKVGQVAARARLEGLDCIAAARRTLVDAPAMDFPAPYSWLD